MTVFGTSLRATPASVPVVPPVTVPATSGAGTRAPAASRPTTNVPIVKRMPPSASPKGGAKAQYDEDMLLLLEMGPLRPGERLIFEQPRKGRRHTAFVESDGGLRFQNARYVSPSGAAVSAAGRSSNGWICWRTTDGRLLDDLRKRARKRKS